MDKEYSGTLHVYSQYGPHDDAIIVGSKDAIAALRDALNRVLEGGLGDVRSCTADGEGFTVQVKIRDSMQYYDRVGLPYTADCFHGSNRRLDPRDPEADEQGENDV